MNIQKYSSLYAKFHGVPKYTVEGNVIILPFTSVQWIKSIALKLQYFDRTFHASKRVLVSAFKAHFKSDVIDTVFEWGESNSILLGNERVVFPSEFGDCRLCATPYFLKGPNTILHYLDGVTKTFDERVFFYKNSVVYLDDCDVPRPGESYFDDVETSDGLFRLCFLTTESKHVIKTLADEWKGRYDVTTDPYKTTYTTVTLSRFFHPSPVNDIHFPENRITGTSLVHKRLSSVHTRFLVQDILNTYRHNGGSLSDVGVFIEYPITVLFDGLSYRSNGPWKFLALAVNGNQPKNVLYIKSPYERYTVYDHTPATLWTHILYDTESAAAPLDRVIIDSTIVGYRHPSGAFLCLSYPMLNESPVYSDLNTECILNIELDPYQDDNLDVIETYYVDGKLLLYKVKHKKMVHELWCVSGKETSVKKYAKRMNPPVLVESWLRLAENWLRWVEQNKVVNYGNLNIVKLALIFAKHKICFKMETSSDRDIVFRSAKEILFKLDEEAINFINDLRLDTYLDKKEEGGGSCKIM